MIALFSWIN